MPYERKGKCVYNKETGKKKGCSSSITKAKEYMKALYASELQERVQKAVKKIINEQFSKEFDDNPALKGKQKKLPDALQKSIIGKKSMKEGGEGETENYMFFSNLKQMHRQIELLMEIDPATIEMILQNGHDWADDHITEAKTNMDQVFDFIMNETEQ
jgi:hypothetical protein